jgi:succinate dehydrogenase / fumarate reductase flavoprotein subunit
MYNRHEMMDVVIVDGKARGIIARNLLTGALEKYAAHCVVLATWWLWKCVLPVHQCMGCNTSALWRVVKRGAYMANPCFTQIHPTCIPVSGDYQSKLTLMSESLRNDGRVWVPKNKADAEAIRSRKLSPTQIKEEDRDYYLERRYPAFGNLVPRDVASRAAKIACDEGYGVNASGLAVYLDFESAIMRYGKSEANTQGNPNADDVIIRKLGEAKVGELYGNLFEMYEKITGR